MTSDHEMREFNRRLDRHYATMQSILHRLTTLEKSCNASHAPSDGSSAASGGTATAASVAPRTASGAATETDPSAAVRDDPKRPGWLEDKHLPLPEGTERVYKCSRSWGDLRAYPGRYFLFASPSPEWSNPGAACDESACTSDLDPVYHVPAPAKFLPPLEIADHAEALGWTEGSRVYAGAMGGFWCFPSGKYLPFGPDTKGSSACINEDTILRTHQPPYNKPLPNRRVPVEGGCQHPPDAIRVGRDFGTGVTATVRMCSKCGLILDEKVEGEKPATAWEEYQAIREDTDPNQWNDAFNRFVADRERRAVEADRTKRLPLPRGEDQVADLVDAAMKGIAMGPGKMAVQHLGEAGARESLMRQAIGDSVLIALMRGGETEKAASPRPAKSAGEVAREFLGDGPTNKIATAKLLTEFAAAIERERTRP